MEELNVKVEVLMKLFFNNKTVINISHNLVQHDRAKNMEMDQHFIKENLESGVTYLPSIPTKDQLADLFTKRLQKLVF